MMIDKPKIPEVKRSCDGCNKCCEGWLPGEAYGHKFWPGNKCHFCKSNGCAIYKDRPHNPCVTFNCAWLIDNSIPEWMKPSECGAIIVKKQLVGEGEHYDIIEAGKKLDSSILSWFMIEHANDRIKSFAWTVDGGNYWVKKK